jgi:fluoroacetyl-CoA thioesterase
MTLEPGLVGQIDVVVADADLADVAGSGDVPVLATPALVAICERATTAAIADELETGQTSVGVRVEIDHVSPARAGSSVSVTATLVEVAGLALRFAVEAASGSTRIGVGEIHRRIVDRDEFLQGIEA